MTSENYQTNSRYQLFRWAAVAYGLGTLIHTLDHLRRGIDTVSTEVFWAGNISTPIAIASIFLAIVGWRYAPVLAVAFGFPHAIGIAAVHLLPHWGVFSDAFPGNGASPVSYIAVLSEIVGAALFASAGLNILLGQRSETPGNSMLASS